MSRWDLLSADEEQHLARKLENREIETWEAVLSNRTLLPRALAAIEAHLGEKTPSFRSLRRADTLARKRRTPAARDRYARTAHTAAAALRAADRDRSALTPVVADLERLGATRKDTAFAAYVRRIRTARRRATVLREEFVQRNLRLVVKLARKYATSNLPLPDLIQEGNVGLMKAVDRFDYRRGFRFSTYACWWIRHHISRAIADKSRTVRRPVHVLDTAHKLNRTQRDLHRKLGREPTAAELGEILGLDETKVRDIRMRVSGIELSLDAPLSADTDRTRMEVLPTPDEVSPEQTAALNEDAKALHLGLRTLQRQDADVLRRRFGIDDGREWTLQEIANVYGLSRERIRQIEVRAMDRLRRALANRGHRSAAS